MVLRITYVSAFIVCLYLLSWFTERNLTDDSAEIVRSTLLSAHRRAILTGSDVHIQTLNGCLFVDDKECPVPLGTTVNGTDFVFLASVGGTNRNSLLIVTTVFGHRGVAIYASSGTIKIQPAP